MPEIANTQMAEYWATVTPTWLQMTDSFEAITGEPGRQALERLAAQPGERIVDVGCGPGRTTLELAGAVGAEGEVLGVDIAPGLLERAEATAAERGITNVTFLHGDVQVQELGRESFDGAFSRFGVMFFADPIRAFGNIKRALRADGRLSFVAWQNAAANEWMSLPALTAMSVLGVLRTPPDPEAPGPLSFADPDRVRRILAEAGFRDVEVAAANDFVVTAEDRVPEVAHTSTRTGVVAELLNDADDETRASVVAAIEKTMRDRVENGEMRAARGYLLVTARA